MTGRRSVHNRTRHPWMLAGVATAAAVALLGACTSDPPRSVESFCTQVREVDDVDEVLASGDPVRTTEELAGLQRLQQVSPPEVEPQVATLVRITEELVAAMATGDPSRAAAEVFSRHRDDLPSITDAGRAVERYTTEHCALTLNPAATVPPATASPAPPTTSTMAAPTTTSRQSTTSSTARSTSTTSRRAGSSTTSTRRSTTTTRRVTTTR